MYSRKNGLFLFQPDENAMNFYSPTLTPPTNPAVTAKDFIDSVRIAEQAAHGKLRDEDIADMTKQDCTYPKIYGQLVHTIKNFTSLTRLLFGDDSILASELSSLLDHINHNELKYQQCFVKDWFFGATFLDRVHVRMQIFLQSCAGGDPQKVAI